MTAKAGGVLDCVNKGMGGNDQTLRSRIDTATMKVNNLKTNVDVLAAGGGGKATWVGTTGNTDGTILDGKGAVGIAAASSICTTAYGAGAHMCTVFEMFDSVSTNVIKDNTVIAKSWVYMEGWNVTLSGPANAGEGLNENCASYVYKTADKRWTGTSVTWAVTALNNTDKALHFLANTPCGTVQPISCCK